VTANNAERSKYAPTRGPQDRQEPRYRPATDSLAHDACPVTGCGGSRVLGRHALGSVTLRVYGSTDFPEAAEPRWYCSGRCATRGIARAELHLDPMSRLLLDDTYRPPITTAHAEATA